MRRTSLIVLLCLTGALALYAQDNKNVINIRQQIMQHKAEDLKEEVDSFHALHLMIGGNVYQTEKHVNYAYDAKTGTYDFTSEFKYVQPLLNLGDVSIVNLKTSFGNNSSDMFSSPDEFALTLKYAGINAVMHANMHTANIDKATLKRTRDVLNQYDMYHTGAFVDQMERTGNYPLIIEKKGFKIAVLNYTKLPSRPEISRSFVINEADKSFIDKDMRMAQAYKPDFIIVYFDWSDNFEEIPTPAQQQLAKYAFEKGADLVVGACPNAPQRIDYLDYFYKGAPHQGLLAYSLGNLLASDEEIKNRSGYLMDIVLKKNIFSNQTVIDDWGIIPVYTYYDTTTVKGKTSVYSVPCWAIESGDIFKNIPYIEKRRVVNGAYEIRKMLGANSDEVQYNLNELIVDNIKETIEITHASLNNKYSQARASDLKPSAPPAAPLAAGNPKSAASLDRVYQQSNGPAQALKQQAVAEKKPAYVKEKEKALKVFAAPDTVAKPVDTVKKQEEVKVEKPEASVLNDTVYRIQFYMLKVYEPLDTTYYTHLKGYEVYQEGGLYKYVIGKFKTYEACAAFWKEQIQPRYKQSFIVMFVNGRRALK